jgi:hypothetical protein
MGFKWDVPPDAVFPQMAQQYTQAIFQAGGRLAQQNASEMEAWAKANAPWQDRTGAARSGLHAEVVGDGGIGTIVLSHGVDYGLWLEIANGGAYAIIAQAIDVFGAKLMDDLQRLLAGGGLAGFTFSTSASRFRSTSSGRFVSRGAIQGMVGQ